MALHELLVLLTRVMADVSRAADAAYLVGQTRDNAASVLCMGAELLRQDLVPMLAVQKGGGNSGYCGFNYCLDALRNLGVPPEAVAAVEFPEEMGRANTLTEHISFARFAKQSGWGQILLVAPPFQQLRAFISAVTAASREHPALKIYNRVGWPLPWNQVATHSQGRLTERRTDLIIAEVERIGRYQRDGQPYPLVSTDAALEYLDRRDDAY